jgi:hypothetical protein
MLLLFPDANQRTEFRTTEALIDPIAQQQLKSGEQIWGYVINSPRQQPDHARISQSIEHTDWPNLLGLSNK